jgi:beta-lactam-binding protein with PASTA domain
MTEDEAEERLAEAAPDLTAEFVPEASEEVDEGEVVRLGEDVRAQMPKGSTIRILVSSGPPGPTVPDVVGWSYDDAADELEDLGLSVQRQFDPDADGDEDEVVAVDPEPGDEVDENGTVTLTVAGDGGAEVPDDLIGMDRHDAVDALHDADLEVGTVFGPRTGEVFATFPSPGSVVESGESIDLFVR